MLHSVISTASSLIISPSLFLWATVSMSCPLGFSPISVVNITTFGSHGGHPIAKTKLVCSVHVSSKCVFPTGLPVSFINYFIIRPCNLPVDVQEAALAHLKDETHLSAWGDLLEKACHPRGLQYSCLENFMDIEAWWATVHRVGKSRSQLKWLNIQGCMHITISFANLKLSQHC